MQKYHFFGMALLNRLGKESRRVNTEGGTLVKTVIDSWPCRLVSIFKYLYVHGSTILGPEHAMMRRTDSNHRAITNKY